MTWLWQPDDVAAPSSRTALGELIRRQRELSALPLRQFATMAGISGPYLSQIERGLRAPSDAVLRAIAESLQTTADALYADAGYTVVEESDDDAPARVAAALEADPELTASQRRSLLETYTAFRDANTVRRRRVADAAAASDGAAPED
jgi:transcriptional regulator with XRE-family HTH domain